MSEFFSNEFPTLTKTREEKLPKAKQFPQNSKTNEKFSLCSTHKVHITTPGAMLQQISINSASVEPNLILDLKDTKCQFVRITT